MCLVDNIEGSKHTLEKTLNRIVPEKWNREFFTHNYEGDDDMPGHLKSSLCGVSLIVPRRIFVKKKKRVEMKDGAAVAGATVNLNEHRNCGGFGGGHRRKIVALDVSSDRVVSKTVEVDSGDITKLCDDFVESSKLSDGILSLTAPHPASGFKIAPKDAGASLLRSYGALGSGNLSQGLIVCGKTVEIFVAGGRVVLGKDQSLWLLTEPKRKAPVVLAAISGKGGG
eukprot:g3372.t1